MATLREAAARYGLTPEEFREEQYNFLQSEGFKPDGHECETLHEWLTYQPKPYRDNTPWQKGDDQQA